MFEKILDDYDKQLEHIVSSIDPCDDFEELVDSI